MDNKVGPWEAREAEQGRMQVATRSDLATPGHELVQKLCIRHIASEFNIFLLRSKE